MNNPNPGVGRIASTFEGLHAKQRKALIPYVTAGWPFANITPALMHGMADAGASIIELGVPFSDPMADGPVIQKAGERALAAGVGLGQVLAHVQEFRQKNHSTPVVLMGYANPFERYDQLRGSGCFARDAAAAGVDGVLVVDSPPEECRDFAAALGAQGIDMIFLLAPTSTEARMRQVAQLASGYVYYVSLRGVTGSGALDVDDVSRMVARIRTHVRLPLGVGFGIRDAASARAISEVADAVIIGSRLIELLDGQPHEKVVPLAADFIRTLRRALDA